MQFSEAEANLIPQPIGATPAVSRQTAASSVPGEGSLPPDLHSKATGLEEQKRTRPKSGGETWQRRLLPLMVGMLVTL